MKAWRALSISRLHYPLSPAPWRAFSCPGDPVLNKTTAEIQQALIALNHDLGVGGPSGRGDDGIWGGKGRTGMMAFQKLQGLCATGVADTETLRRLFPADPTMPTSLPPWYVEIQRRKGLHETTN